jgi:hypothetical protein
VTQFEKIPEEVELEIFSRLYQGQTRSKIAREVGVGTATISRLKKLGRPRFRTESQHVAVPTQALIAWHCRQFQQDWSPDERARRLIMQPANVECPVFSAEELGFSPEWELGF